MCGGCNVDVIVTNAMMTVISSNPDCGHTISYPKCQDKANGPQNDRYRYHNNETFVWSWIWAREEILDFKNHRHK